MTNEATYREKGQSLFLAAMLVLSVVAMTAAFAGSAAAINADTYDEGPTFTSTAEGDVDDQIWLGQEFTVETENNVQLRQGLDSTNEDAEVVDEAQSENGEVSFDTSDLEADTFYHLNDLSNANTEGNAVFNLVSEDLDVEFDGTAAEDGTVPVDFASDRNYQTVNVTSEEFDGEQLHDIFSGEGNYTALHTSEDAVHDDDDVLTIEQLGEGDGALEANFDSVDVSAGDEVEFDFMNTDSIASDNATVEITDDSQEAEIIDTDTIEEGDIGNITIDVANTDEVAVSVGDGAEGHVANLTLGDYDTDNDEIVLEYNTYNAGGVGDSPSFGEAYDSSGVDTAAADVGFTAHNASITGYNVDTELNEGEALPNANWDVEVGSTADDTTSVNDYAAADFLDDSNDRATFVIEQRSAPGDTVIQTAPTDTTVANFGDFEDATVTETDTIATADADTGDHLFVTVEDFGANGSIESLNEAGGLDEAFFDQTGLALNISEQDSGAVGDAAYWNTSYNADEDSDAGQMLDVESLIDVDEYDTNEELAGDLIFKVNYEGNGFDVSDKSYDINFSIDADNSNILSEDYSTESEFSFEEAELEWDEVSEMPANAESNATGTTNLAPGTEITADADSPNEEGGFLESADPEVAADGTFEASFDLSEETVGSMFDVNAEGPLSTDDTVEDVELVESTDENESDEEGIGLDVEYDDIEEGETAEIDAIVENFEDENTTVDIELSIGEETYDRTVDLEGDSSTTQTFAFEGDNALGVGDHSFDVTAESDNDNESASGTLTVSEAGSGDDGSEDGSEDGGSEDGGSEDGGSEDGDTGSEDDDSEDDGSSSVPGFGVAVALVALLSAAMLALRKQD